MWPLRNNVSTPEMEMTIQQWPPGTEDFVPHHVLGRYIQDAAAANGILENTRFNTRVTDVAKENAKWRLETARMSGNGPEAEIRRDVEVGVACMMQVSSADR